MTTLRRIGAAFGPRLARYTATAALVAYCVLGVPLLVGEISRLPLLDEAGYGDSYILYDVLNYQKTGTIYRDLSQPPYLPVQYSPLVYAFYSLPGRLTTWVNPFEGPRLLVLVSFFTCVALVVSIVHVLVPVRFAWVWAILLALSVNSFWGWILQIRGDFPGICFALLAVRLLLARSRWAVPLAGLCAGLAMQFKITFVAAAAAGTVWLLIRRQWIDVARFTMPAAMAAIVPYALFSMREPRMLTQMLALSPGIVDVLGDLALVKQVAADCVVLLALFGLLPVVRRFWPRWALLIIFATLSFVVAGLTALQAGGNDNYFFEAVFAMVPLAVFGALRLLALAPRNPVATLFVVVLFAIHFLAPRMLLLYGHLTKTGTVASHNAEFRKLEQALQGHRIFSTVPRLALIDPEPPIVEPILFFYLQRLGKIDPEIILAGLRQREYAVVITVRRSIQYRGLMLVGPQLREAIASTYRPHCLINGWWLFHLPHEPKPDSDALARDLALIGCEPVSASAAAEW